MELSNAYLTTYLSVCVAASVVGSSSHRLSQLHAVLI